MAGKKKTRRVETTNVPDTREYFPVSLYNKALDIFARGVSAGAANVPLSMTSLDAVFDLLHGGAKFPQEDGYGNEVLPSIMYQASPGNEINSPYYVGVPIDNFLKSQIVISLFGVDVHQLGAGDLAEIYADANVPSLFPKILSDQFMGRWAIFRAQTFSANLFINVGTGLKTYVEAAKEAVETSLLPLEATTKAATSLIRALSSAVPESGETPGG